MHMERYFLTETCARTLICDLAGECRRFVRRVVASNAVIAGLLCDFNTLRPVERVWSRGAPRFPRFFSVVLPCAVSGLVGGRNCECEGGSVDVLL